MPKLTAEATPTQYQTTTGDAPRKYDKPVKWLLGRQLLRSMKGILLYTAYGKQLDPRDWMRPEAFPEPAKPEEFDFWRKQKLKREHPKALAEEMEEEKKKNPSDADYWREKGEFWFDYISDTGDGMLATYSLAYLCLSDLYAPQALNAGDEIKTCSNKREIQTAVSLLPRGEFLLVGGDAAYHVSDYMTLARRVQIPFGWAYSDVAEDRRKSGDPANPEEEPNRPIFGIPGNHDYYDQLNGFRRQFHIPVRKELGHGYYQKTKKPEELAARPQLYMPGFNRYQQASYVALRLPFDWWLWGLDTEVGQVDERQQEFFRDLCKVGVPKKLIVATCAPTTVFGKMASTDDKKSAGAFEQLGLDQLFLPKKREDGQYESLSGAGDGRMEPGQCRLDISGDVHHYARYWGPKPTKPDKVRKGANAPAPAAESYASVVSGIGGAFHHPSETYVDQVQEQALYPSEEQSTGMVARRIFNPYQIAGGGNIWLAGLISAFVICFAITMTPSVHSFANLVKDLFSGDALNKLFGESWGMRIGELLIFLSPVPLIRAAANKKLFEKASGESHAKPEAKLWAKFAVSFLALGFGFFLAYGSSISLFGSSLIIQFSIIWAVAAIAMSFRYSEFLFEKSHWAYIQLHDWALTWALTISGLLSVASGLWLFGEKLTPAGLISDLIFMWVAGGGFVGLILLPIFVGADLCQPRTAAPGSGQNGTLSFGRKVSRALFGLWNAILQIGTPYLFVSHMAMMTRMEVIVLIVITAALIIAMCGIGGLLLKDGHRKALAVVWVAYGALTLALPWLLREIAGEAGAFIPIELRSGLLGLWWALVAGLIGLVMSCVWFGWYLGVCFAFNGHNNEVGGACMIEEFKQFVRFRLTKDGLTGYVIAVDHPQRQGRNLKPRVVDIFHLRVKPADSAAVAAKEGVP
jgi:hypothetical protein